MKRKCLWLVCLLVLPPGVARAQNRELQARRVKNPRVAYARAARVRSFPLPVVNFVREGLARPGDVKEIMDGVVYPLVNRSAKPIAAVVVTFSPDAQGNVAVLVLWHGTDFKDVLVERNARGHFPADAYKAFLEDVAAEPR
ncbi:MAG TPA: hypothetical protein VF611_02130 [Pyrinomonadaceae bacterium]